MTLAVPLDLEPMEAASVGELPTGRGWQYEPKYDGFRALLFKDGDVVHLQSRNGKPLDRYFPEIVAAAVALPADRVVIDGELVIEGRPFSDLQLRLHPAASRVAKLAAEIPATLIAFDLLADPADPSLVDSPFGERRHRLKAFFAGLDHGGRLILGDATTIRRKAEAWLARLGKGLDGIVAKRLDLPYRAGERAMAKFKVWRTVDCVVGGLYYRQGSRSIVEYLLLGLYDDAGRLNYVGRCGWPGDGAEAGSLFAPLVGGEGFTGNAPAGISRWSGRQRQVVPLRHQVVVEASADHVEAGRFRHGSRLVRIRDDKLPAACTMDQLDAPIGRRAA